MLPYFIFNDINSKDLGVVINKLPPISMAERNIEQIEVVGRSGFLTRDFDTYKAITKPVECTITDSTKIPELVKLLSEPFGKVTFSNEPNVYYECVIINQIDFQDILCNFSSFIIQFECQPFKKLIEEDIISSISGFNFKRKSTAINPLRLLNYRGDNVLKVDEAATVNYYDETVKEITFINTGNRVSNPIITLFGTGNIKLFVNEETITLKDVDGEITINSEMMECYKGKLIQNNKMYGEFPLFKIGENKIRVDGNIFNINIINNTIFV